MDNICIKRLNYRLINHSLLTLALNNYVGTTDIGIFRPSPYIDPIVTSAGTKLDAIAAAIQELSGELFKLPPLHFVDVRKICVQEIYVSLIDKISILGVKPFAFEKVSKFYLVSPLYLS